MAFEGLEKTGGGGNFAKWDILGRKYGGIVVRKYVDTPNFEDAVPCPHVDLADGTTVSATQTVLRNLLIERDEEFDVGDYVEITWSGQAGNAKLFTLVVAHAGTAEFAAYTGGAPVAPVTHTAAAVVAPAVPRRGVDRPAPVPQASPLGPAVGPAVGQAPPLAAGPPATPLA